jgi:hypothetical protein
VPIPQSTITHVDHYLIERASTGDKRLTITDRAPLFVQHDGTSLTHRSSTRCCDA